MKISVITICRNEVDSIEETILSVINQTHSDIEYIIVDGASTDGTLEVIEKYRDRISKVISEADTGIYNAMNKGILLASGDLLNFMNAGDTFACLDAVGLSLKRFSKLNLDQCPLFQIKLEHKNYIREVLNYASASVVFSM